MERGWRPKPSPPPTRSDGRIYARRLSAPTGESIVTLGLDAAGDQRQGAAVLLSGLMASVASGGFEPRLLLQQRVSIGAESVLLHGYTCMGDVLNDSQSALWTWTGWLPPEEVDVLAEAEGLSQESALLYRSLRNASRLS